MGLSTLRIRGSEKRLFKRKLMKWSCVSVCYHGSNMHMKVNVSSVLPMVAQSHTHAVEKLWRYVSPCFAWVIYMFPPLQPTVSAFTTNSFSFDALTCDWGWYSINGVPCSDLQWIHSPALAEQRDGVFPSLAWIPYQEPSVLVLRMGNNTRDSVPRVSE